MCSRTGSISTVPFRIPEQLTHLATLATLVDKLKYNFIGQEPDRPLPSSDGIGQPQRS
jgi:hypothetical protein